MPSQGDTKNVIAKKVNYLELRKLKKETDDPRTKSERMSYALTIAGLLSGGAIRDGVAKFTTFLGAGLTFQPRSYYDSLYEEYDELQDDVHFAQVGAGGIKITLDLKYKFYYDEVPGEDLELYFPNEVPGFWMPMGIPSVHKVYKNNVEISKATFKSLIAKGIEIEKNK